ncbi:MAG: InlB B-repeat-containing protein [Lachnospira sp.]
MKKRIFAIFTAMILCFTMLPTVALAENGSYIVKLNTNGGTINNGDVTGYTYGQGATLPTDVTKTGYMFKGWYDNQNLTGNPVTAIDITAAEDKEYWAKWEDVPTVTIDGADTVCVTQDYQFSFSLPEGVTKVECYNIFAKHGGGVPLTNENGKLYGTITAGSYMYDDEDFKIGVNLTIDDSFTFTVSKSVKIQREHTGGEATCTISAICEVCGSEYGEKDGNNHNLENIPAKDATVTENGNIEYWHCLDCGKYFFDKDGKNSIELIDTVIPKLSLEITEGMEQSLTAGEKKELTFRFDVVSSDFIRVEMNGKTVDEKNYSFDGTVLTLNADYVGALSEGEHTISIVSESGTATTAFTVNAKTVEDNGTNSPQTGNNSHIALWFALLFVSFGLLAVIRRHWDDVTIAS